MPHPFQPKSAGKTRSSLAFEKFRATAAVRAFIILSVTLFLISFSTYKAATTSFTHDESYSYLHYVQQSFMDIVSYKTPFTNNHILNSLGMKYAERLFGSSELSLRLPNLLALIIYLFFTYRLTLEMLPPLRIPAFLTLSLNPYLLDFFGLARGYGLSIGLMIMSLYFLNRYLQTDKNRDSSWFNASAFLAVLSNFALINYYIAGLIAYNAFILLQKYWFGEKEGTTRNFFRHNAIHGISLLTTIGVIYEPFRKIFKHGFVNFGGQTGILADTVESSLVRFFYLAPVKPNTWGVAPIEPAQLILLKTFVVLIPCLTMMLVLYHLIIKDRSFFENARPLVVTNGVLLLIVLGTILQFHLFATQYLKERFALFLVPLFLLNLLFLFNELARSSKGRFAGIGLTCLIALLFFVNTARHLNTRYYLDWKYDLATKDVISVLIDEKATGKYERVHLGANWLFSPTLNFYRVTRQLNWLTEIYQHGGLGEYDHFFYEFAEDLPKQEQNLSEKEVLMTVDEIGTRLLRIRAGD